MAQDVKKKFGERLRELREKEGLTQAQLAKILNISRAALGYYENAERTPDIETLDLAATHFKVTSDYLLGRTSNKTNDTELQAVCEFTGLSENACEFLHKMQGFAKGCLKSDLYYFYLKERENEANALQELYTKYPELKGIIEEFEQCDSRGIFYDEYAKKHPFFDEAFRHWVSANREEDINYSLRAYKEEAQKNLMVINLLFTTEKIWDLTHLLVVYFFTDFTKGTITATVTNEDYGNTNVEDGGRAFTFTHATLENGMLSEITDIIKSLKTQCTPKYRLCDVIQEENFEANHNTDYILRQDSNFNYKESEKNG